MEIRNGAAALQRENLFFVVVNMKNITNKNTEKIGENSPNY